jgi:hypothetical protein
LNHFHVIISIHRWFRVLRGPYTFAGTDTGTDGHACLMHLERNNDVQLVEALLLERLELLDLALHMRTPIVAA